MVAILMIFLQSTIAKTVPRSKGAMLVPVLMGLDKTTVSVATGHQEYHPVYISAGNLTNMARRSHGAGVTPVAFLPIPKGTHHSLALDGASSVGRALTQGIRYFTVSKRERGRKDYQLFARQLYQACLQFIYEPLREGMSAPEIVRCPDGHFRRAIYSIGPVIADYPEQVWLSAIVQGWCPK